MLTIRMATEQDAPLVAWTIGESFLKQAEVLGISRSEYPNYVAFETEAGVRRRLDSGAQIVLGSLGDQIAGTVSWTVHRDGRAEIMRLSVLPSHRGNGYGRELMTYAETRLASAGATAIELSIVAALVRLRSYYEDLGYTATESKRVPSLPFDVLYMRKIVSV